MAAVEEHDLEGIVAKRKADPYRRGVPWRKIKNAAYSQAQGGRGAVAQRRLARDPHGDDAQGARAGRLRMASPETSPSILATLAISVVIPALSGFAGGLVAWAAGVFLGKPLARFYDLRLEAQTQIFVIANITTFPQDEARAEKAQSDLRRIAGEIEALRVVLPRLALWILSWRGYDLALASTGLTGLSNSLHTSDGSKAVFRVKARTGLRLFPIDPTDQAVHDRRIRVENAKL